MYKRGMLWQDWGTLILFWFSVILQEMGEWYSKETGMTITTAAKFASVYVENKGQQPREQILGKNV